MPTSDDHWRWAVRGFTRIGGMLQEMLADGAMAPMSEDALMQLEETIRMLTFVRNEQVKRRRERR